MIIPNGQSIPRKPVPDSTEDELKAEANFKKYSQQTNHELADLRSELKNITDDILRKEKEVEIAKKQAELKRKEQENENKRRVRNEYNRKNWDRKGTKDNPTIFHTEKKKEKPKKRGPKM